MNLILINHDDVDEAGQHLTDKRVSQHLQYVIKSQEGDLLRVGIVNGQRGVAQVIEIKSQGKETLFQLQLLPLQLHEVEDVYAKLSEKGDTQDATAGDETDSPTHKRRRITHRFPPLTLKQRELWRIHPYAKEDLALVAEGVRYVPQPLVDVCMCIPRPRTFDKTLQYLASMSIGNLYFFTGTRSDLAYFSSPKMSEQHIQSALLLGLEQSGKTVVPNVTVAASWKMMQEILDNEVNNKGDLIILAHPYPVEDCKLLPQQVVDTPLLSHKGGVVIILGPEGGFLDSEIVSFGKLFNKLHLVHLGSDILRCEVAAVYLLAQVKLLTSQSSLREEAAQRTRSLGLESKTRLPIRGPRHNKEASPQIA